MQISDSPEKILLRVSEVLQNEESKFHLDAVRSYLSKLIKGNKFSPQDTAKASSLRRELQRKICNANK